MPAGAHRFPYSRESIGGTLGKAVGNMAAIIHDCAILYQEELLDRHVLLIPNDGSKPVEVFFGEENFKHLCGVEHPLRGARFFRAAIDGRLDNERLIRKYKRKTNVKLQSLPDILRFHRRADAFGAAVHVEGLVFDIGCVAMMDFLGFLYDAEFDETVPQSAMRLSARPVLEWKIAAIARTKPHSDVYIELTKGGGRNGGRALLQRKLQSLKLYERAKCNVAPLKGLL